MYIVAYKDRIPCKHIVKWGGGGVVALLNYTPQNKHILISTTCNQKNKKTHLQTKWYIIKVMAATVDPMESWGTSSLVVPTPSQKGRIWLL